MSSRGNAEEVARSVGFRKGLLKPEAAGRKTKHPRNNRKMTKTQTRHIKRKAIEGDYSAACLKSDLQFPIGVRRVQHMLKPCECLR